MAVSSKKEFWDLEILLPCQLDITLLFSAVRKHNLSISGLKFFIIIVIIIIIIIIYLSIIVFITFFFLYLGNMWK